MNRVLIGIAALALFAACDSGSTATDKGPGIDVPADTASPDVPVVPDTEDRDTAAEDPGPADLGPTDLGPTDPGPADLGPTDLGPTDPGPTDPGPTDLGPTDLGPADLGPADPGVQDVATHPASHTEDMSGVFHKPGKEDPLKNCTSCHGAQLKGDVGPSCYDCHNNDDHTSIRGGVPHLGGSSSTCVNCHGPKSGTSAKSSTGGLGPACGKCH